MKKLFLALALVMTVTTVTVAQTNDKTIGIRGGNGTELSYQHPLSGNTRVELDLGLPGWKYAGIVLSGVHQWLWNIDGGLDWYAGVGAQVGSIRWATGDPYNFGLGVAGQIGIEYNFPIPLQLSLDWRPVWNILNSGHGFGYDSAALGIRYRF